MSDDELPENDLRFLELHSRFLAAGPFPGISASEGHEYHESVDEIRGALRTLRRILGRKDIESDLPDDDVGRAWATRALRAEALLAELRKVATTDEHSFDTSDFCGPCSSGERGRACRMGPADRDAHRARGVMRLLLR